MAPSKMVIDRKKSVDSVAAAGTTHAERIALALNELLGKGAGEAATTLLGLSGKALQEKIDALLAADERHGGELADDKGIRGARDEAALVVHDKLVADREVLTGVAGAAYVAAIGFTGVTPDQPDEVLAFARVVEKRLGEVKAPKSRLPGYEFDAAKWRKEYAPIIQRLDDAIAKVGTEVREAEATQVDKNRAIVASDRTFSRVATLVSALLELGEEPELAARVRPSKRRAGVTAELGGDPLPPAPVAPVPTKPVDA